MDLSQLPEVGTYEEAVAKIQEIIKEAENLQKRLSELNAEVTYYQGVAKALEPKNNISTKSSSKKSK